jgi:hypothetical protein
MWLLDPEPTLHTRICRALLEELAATYFSMLASGRLFGKANENRKILNDRKKALADAARVLGEVSLKDDPTKWMIGHVAVRTINQNRRMVGNQCRNYGEG